MTADIKTYGKKPIEFSADQDGWVTVHSYETDSVSAPFHPRRVLVCVGLGGHDEFTSSDVTAPLTIEQATDLVSRLIAAMGVDRHATTPTPAPGLDLDAVERAERAMTPGPWESKIYTTHVAGTSQETQWHEAIVDGGAVVCETECSVFEDESAIGAANIRGIVALRNAAPALIAEVRALRAAAEEREADMHARIRAGYDKTVADAWRAEVAKRDAEIADLRALVESQRRDYLDVRLTAELAAARKELDAAAEAGIKRGRSWEATEWEMNLGVKSRDEAIKALTAARGTVGGLLATAPVGAIVEWRSSTGRGWWQLRVRIDGNGVECRTCADGWPWGGWRAGQLLAGDMPRSARLVPAAEADADPNQRGPLPKGG